jgi:hypothetical protein
MADSARLLDLGAFVMPGFEVNYEEDNYAAGYNQTLADVAGGD